jgi:hypothetical protein
MSRPLPPPSQRQLRRLAPHMPKLIDMLEELDLPDRKTPLAPGFSGPRLRLVNDMRRRLGVTPFQLEHRPPPGDLFVALVVTLAEAKAVFRAARRKVNRHAYPRSFRVE